MTFESPRQFSDAEEIKVAVSDTEAMLSRVQAKAGAEHVGNRVAELLDLERELTEPEKTELNAGIEFLDNHVKKTAEDATTKSAKESIDPVIGGSDQIDANQPLHKINDHSAKQAA